MIPVVANVVPQILMLATAETCRLVDVHEVGVTWPARVQMRASKWQEQFVDLILKIC